MSSQTLLKPNALRHLLRYLVIYCFLYDSKGDKVTFKISKFHVCRKPNSMRLFPSMVMANGNNETSLKFSVRKDLHFTKLKQKLAIHLILFQFVSNLQKML